MKMLLWHFIFSFEVKCLRVCKQVLLNQKAFLHFKKKISDYSVLKFLVECLADSKCSYCLAFYFN